MATGIPLWFAIATDFTFNRSDVFPLLGVVGTIHSRHFHNQERLRCSSIENIGMKRREGWPWLKQAPNCRAFPRIPFRVEALLLLSRRLRAFEFRLCEGLPAEVLSAFGSGHFHFLPAAVREDFQQE